MQEARKEAVILADAGAAAAPPTPQGWAVRRVVVTEEAAGQRLDNFLSRQLKGVPKSRIYQMLRTGQVRVGGRRAQPDLRLQPGDEVRIPPVRTAAPASAEPPRPGRSLLPHVVYRDDALLALDKPAGQAVHGGSGVSLGVIEQLRLELPQCRFLELVHRLDKDTSGLLLVALKRPALTGLHRMLREGGVRKTYLALAVGRWRGGEREVRLALRKYVTAEGERRVSVHAEGQTAQTLLRPLRHYPGFTLVEARIVTGRTHQIRVHLASLGHPIAGDDKYGDFDLNRQLRKQGLRRMFLHAARLEFNHPLTGESLSLASPLPAELERFLTGLERPDG
ncbi:MAG: RluA family pseudouridine synthase [Thiobacillaceae bacterium]|nr:RluA family pseudouridine synthase [Thiobacillaceae bacterium]